ncbi:MFS transporter [Kitasatospora sp. NPDC057198]|uniref:serine/threonine-protein kinase n=1 Tax=Kitasatospora sp. NPDC057198 TaxID=3346046 RepID=UPI003633BDE5
MDALSGEDPSHIGPYRLIARLGAGGMGLVYLGRSEAGRTVAVKVVQAELAERGEFRRRFAREVAAARQVGGSWTADVLDADTGAAVPWVATQYVPGPSLAAVVARDFGPLPERSVRILANRLARALQAVHGAGLIHRDLKPSNVLVTVDGPRVIDFGIVRAVDGAAGAAADSLRTGTGVVVGSPAFMSPEQARSRELTAASDVFSLGSVLVYAATGRVPFDAEGSDVIGHLVRIASEEPDLTGLPASLDALVRACLDKDPARRPTPEQIAARTDGDDEVWLPAEILIQLGRHAAQLLDFVPEPRSTAEPVRAPGSGYTPTERAHLPSPAATTAVPVPAAATTAVPVPPAPAPAPRRENRESLESLESLENRSSRGSRGSRVVPALAQLAVVLGLVHGNWTTGAFSLRGSGLPWFAMAFAALLLPGGHLADLAGRRRALSTGLAGFAAAYLFGLLGPVPDKDGPLQFAVSFLQGGFGALALAASLAVAAAAPRGPGGSAGAFGTYASITVAGTVAGLLGLAQSTPDLVLSVGVLAALAALLGTLALPADAPRPGRERVRFAPLGVLLGALGPGALAFGTAQRWLSPAMLVPSVVGLTLIEVLWWQQRSGGGRLLPPDTRPARHRLGGLLVTALTGAGFLCLLPALAFVVSWGSNRALVATLAPMVLLALGAVLGAAWARIRLSRPGASPRTLAVAGLLTAAAGLLAAVLALMNGGGPTAPLSVATAVAGLGAGLALVPVFSCAAATAVPGLAGGAAGALATAQFAGQAVGTAVLHGTDTPSWWAVGLLLLAALLAGAMLPSRSPLPQDDGPTVAATTH